MWESNILEFIYMYKSSIDKKISDNYRSGNCPAMNEKDFQFLYNVIKKKSFDDDRLEILSVGVLDNYFTCQQCVRLMSLYRFDDDKLKIIRIMANHIVDLENHYDILMRLDFESNKRKALDILNVHKYYN